MRPINMALETAIRAIVVALMAGITLWYVLLAEPVTYLSTDIVTPEVRAGERATIIYTRDAHWSCRSEIVQRVVSERSGDEVWRVMSIGAASKRGVQTARVSVPTQPDWEPGTYVYSPIATYECGPFTIGGAIPPAKFTVLPR